MPFLSRSRFCLTASAGQLKSLVLQREGAVSFIQLFSTSTSVCQGGGKRRLNTLCNSTRPDAVLLRFNVPFFCLCCCKRLAGWGRERTKSRQSEGYGEIKRRKKQTKQPLHVRASITRLISKVPRRYYMCTWQRQQCACYMLFSSTLGGVVVTWESTFARIIAAFVATYLRKRSTRWSRSVCLASWAINYVSSKMQSGSTQVLQGSVCVWACALICAQACVFLHA